MLNRRSMSPRRWDRRISLLPQRGQALSTEASNSIVPRNQVFQRNKTGLASLALAASCLRFYLTFSFARHRPGGGPELQRADQRCHFPGTMCCRAHRQPRIVRSAVQESAPIELANAFSICACTAATVTFDTESSFTTSAMDATLPRPGMIFTSSGA